MSPKFCTKVYFLPSLDERNLKKNVFLDWKQRNKMPELFRNFSSYFEKWIKKITLPSRKKKKKMKVEFVQLYFFGVCLFLNIFCNFSNFLFSIAFVLFSRSSKVILLTSLSSLGIQLAHSLRLLVFFIFRLPLLRFLSWAFQPSSSEASKEKNFEFYFRSRQQRPNIISGSLKFLTNRNF